MHPRSYFPNFQVMDPMRVSVHHQLPWYLTTWPKETPTKYLRLGYLQREHHQQLKHCHGSRQRHFRRRLRCHCLPYLELRLREIFNHQIFTNPHHHPDQNQLKSDLIMYRSVVLRASHLSLLRYLHFQRFLRLQHWQLHHQRCLHQRQHYHRLHESLRLREYHFIHEFPRLSVGLHQQHQFSKAH